MSFLKSTAPGTAYNIDAAIPLASDVVLAVYNARADALASARLQAIAKQVNAHGNAVNAGGNDSRSITLTLIATTTPGQPAVVRPTSAASSGKPPQTAAQAPTTGPVASVTFDVAPLGGYGFAQSISKRTEARQTIHETAGGYYVDSYGLKPGDFSIEATVVFTDDNIAAHVQVFKNLLLLAKTSATPLSPDPPPRLQYKNSIDGRTLYLTQASLDVTQNAANPRMATVTIRGAILSDVSIIAKTGVNPSASAALPSTLAQPAMLISGGDGTAVDPSTLTAGVG